MIKESEQKTILALCFAPLESFPTHSYWLEMNG